MDVSGILIGIAIPILSGILLTILKKGKFENWGNIAGRWLSWFGSKKLGKASWERIENVITVSILSFAKGFRDGADSDDNILDVPDKFSNKEVKEDEEKTE